MADKVRYYLEQAVPELEDLEKKNLFTKNELSIIMRRRTDFEYRINGRQAKPRDFVKYAEYEMNVEKLRKKRVQRIKPKKTGKSPSEYAGPRRILFIFDRGTKKFAGDLSLWMHYLDYAKATKSINVVSKILTSLLQLHPTKPDVWIMAAKYEADENASMRAARAIMQRGLRFNQESVVLWLEYIKLELLYVSKILDRRRLLGIQSKHEAQQAAAKETDPNDGSIKLPDLDIKDDLKSLPDADMSMLGSPESNPALRGDIALAIYDSAMTSSRLNSKQKHEMSLKVLQLFDKFTDLDRFHLCQHVISHLMTQHDNDPEIVLLDILLPIRHVAHTDQSFPDRLKLTITKYKKATNDKIKPLFQAHIDKYLEEELTPPLDPNIKLVLQKFASKRASM